MEISELNKITDIIIGAAFEVFNELGSGFLEKVYENSLTIQLLEKGLVCETQKEIEVFYHNQLVGEYIADIFVENEIILELKAVKELSEVHKNQLLNYLKASNKELGLLLNFSPTKVEIKRVINNLNT